MGYKVGKAVRDKVGEVPEYQRVCYSQWEGLEGVKKQSKA